MGTDVTLICVDSRAAILAATGNKPELQAGYYILDWFHRQQEALISNMITWQCSCDGHIAGNEAADEAARTATESDTTPNDRLPKFLWERMPHSSSSLRPISNKNINIAILGQAFHGKLKTMETNL